MIIVLIKKRTILTPHAVPSTRYDQAMKERPELEEEEGLGGIWNVQLADPDHNGKFTSKPIDWSQYDRLDILCFAVHTILTTIRTEAALAEEDGHSLDAIPELPPGLDYKDEVSLAYRLLSVFFMKDAQF
ncbi:hypothetical protein LTR22_022675 [Elasticomyces elasticus]|nr:hypothetical protein LTR22_022675 [Elasticomyces elasticus]KAK4918778.1 hypothetical protein LTR49_013565 [Elasticomyces elasticus]KAK5754394.1 hypothetical protein LTS12_015463 [Elasticomyces elasticus]